ncbi:glycosyltransferase [Owenweeksia hongkongensis]|uniref:glycosyltransferase n=1 Tax=Owenweeksia hongkongensis TaxID=253245 RepID=UPI003A8DDA15
MKILLTSIGTRGDMEPILAIGEILKKHNHDIVCLFPEQFRSMAEESGFRFASLGSDFLNMLNSDDGKAAMGGSSSGIKKNFSYIKLATKFSTINKNMLEQQRLVIEAEQPDRIVHNGKVIYPIIWGRKHPGKTILNDPIPYVAHPVKNHAHVAFNGNYGAFLNKLTYKLANFGLIKTVMKSVKTLKLKDGITQRDIAHALESNKTIYTVSPALFTRPDYWPEQAKVLGYHERDKTLSWKSDVALENFIAKHPKILFITFGSMTNPAPEKKTAVILDILQRNNIPAIINTSSGGLQQPAGFHSENIHFVSSIPYEKILPKMYAIMHHGGSGTTHMAMKYGCASLIIPHIIDQFMWNDLLSKKGAGPKGPSIGKVKLATLENKILDLWNNESYKSKAQEIALVMNKENFKDEVYQFVTES